MPFATFADSTQVAVPVLQVVVPVRHGLPVTLQLAPTLHAPQAPVVLQTMSVPQVVPAANRVPLSVHWAVPVVQSRAPW